MEWFQHEGWVRRDSESRKCLAGGGSDNYIKFEVFKRKQFTVLVGYELMPSSTKLGNDPVGGKWGQTSYKNEIQDSSKETWYFIIETSSLFENKTNFKK